MKLLRVTSVQENGARSTAGPYLGLTVSAAAPREQIQVAATIGPTYRCTLRLRRCAVMAKTDTYLAGTPPGPCAGGGVSATRTEKAVISLRSGKSSPRRPHQLWTSR